jgi:hypothetical protein
MSILEDRLFNYNKIYILRFFEIIWDFIHIKLIYILFKEK